MFALEKRLLVSSCLSVCLSVRMEKPDSRWTDFHEIWYDCFSKSVEKEKIALKSDINNSSLHGGLCTFMGSR